MAMASWFILVLCSFVVPAFSQSNGMDMSMDTPMNLAAGNMLPYLHFTPGDTVWFPGWVPRSAGTMIGTCIGVFLLSVLERWLAACLQLAEHHWAERAGFSIIEGADDINSVVLPSGSLTPSQSPSASEQSKSWFPPFMPEYDITRGVLYAAQRFVQVLLMLVVMTFQLAFILSIAIGSGVGETMFGRFSSLPEH